MGRCPQPRHPSEAVRAKAHPENVGPGDDAHGEGAPTRVDLLTADARVVGRDVKRLAGAGVPMRVCMCVCAHVRQGVVSRAWVCMTHSCTWEPIKRTKAGRSEANASKAKQRHVPHRYEKRKRCGGFTNGTSTGRSPPAITKDTPPASLPQYASSGALTPVPCAHSQPGGKPLPHCRRKSEEGQVKEEHS